MIEKYLFGLLISSKPASSIMFTSLKHATLELNKYNQT